MPPAARAKGDHCDTSRSFALVGGGSGTGHHLAPGVGAGAGAPHPGLAAWTVAVPGPSCHCGAVNAGPVSAGARRACLLLAITGSVLLMSGVLLVAGSGILGDDRSRGWQPATLIALGLIISGLLCGAVIVAIAAPGNRRASGRIPRLPRAARPRRPARLLSRPVPETWPGPQAWPTSAPPPAQAGRPAPQAPPAADGPVPPGPEGLPSQNAPPAHDAGPAPSARPVPAPRPAPARRRAPATRRAPAPRPAPEARPAPEEEWMQAFRPDGPPPIPRPPPQRGGDDS
jgi:hypothetical protein